MIYNEDFRLAVIKYLEAGHTREEANITFGVGFTTMNRWWREYQKLGKTKPSSRKKFDPEKLRAYVKEHPKASSREIGMVFGCAHSTVQRVCKRHKIPLNIYSGKVDPDKFRAYVQEHPDAYLKDVAKAFGCSLETVKRTSRKFNIRRKKPKHPRTKLDPEMLKLYIKEHPNMSYRKISKAFGCSDTAVQKACKRLGISRQKPT